MEAAGRRRTPSGGFRHEHDSWGELTGLIPGTVNSMKKDGRDRPTAKEWRLIVGRAQALSEKRDQEIAEYEAKHPGSQAP